MPTVRTVKIETIHPFSLNALPVVNHTTGVLHILRYSSNNVFEGTVK